jgi:hypothetical protein
LAAAATGGVVYAVGGELGSASTAQAVLEAFDTRTLRWERLPPMPTPRGELAAAVFDGRIHVVGGMTPAGALDAHEAYDPQERRWLPLHPLATPRHGLGAAVAEGRLFAIAGGSGAAGSPTGITEELVAPLLDRPLSRPAASGN